ncbi:MAG: alanine racemase [Thermodesulfobacteriota bacterium]
MNHINSCTSFNRVIVNLEALKQNYRFLQAQAPQAEMLAMIKADGYGHGMIECGHALAECGCSNFGVGELCEAVALRESGIKGQILVMLGFNERHVNHFIEYDLTPVIYDLQSAKMLSECCLQLDRAIGYHLKVDCGMSRLGIYPGQLEDFFQQAKQFKGVFCKGVLSHFARSDEQDPGHSRNSLALFEETVASVTVDEKLKLHIANSGGLLYYPESSLDIVRPGISLYGYYPDTFKARDDRAEGGLQPVMSFHSQVVQVKEVAAGQGISYGHTYVTDSPATIAVLPVGYEDGLSRRLSNRGAVLIHGKRAPIRGRICMNLTMVDVTHIPGVKAGDEVVIMGAQSDEKLSADDIGQWMETISYEVLCMFGNNNERQYL